MIRIMTVGFALLTVFQLLYAQEPAWASDFPLTANRTWIGPDYWANPMQDWKLEQGKLVCRTLGQGRNVHLLTRRLGSERQPFRMSVRLEWRMPPTGQEGWAGFRIGAKGQFGDYRDDAVYGQGLDVGLAAGGNLFVGKAIGDQAISPDSMAKAPLVLDITAIPNTQGRYRIRFTVWREGRQSWLAQMESLLPDSLSLEGQVALVSHFAPPSGASYSRVYQETVAFRDWELEGKKVVTPDEHRFGPILFAQYTLSEGIMKLTAQLPPTGSVDAQEVELAAWIKGQWRPLVKAPVDSMARTAAFRISNWPDTTNMAYLLTYDFVGKNDRMETDSFTGIIRKEPIEQEVITVAAFTGNNDLGFPNQDIVRNVARHCPDLLFFSGDQIYEPVGGFGNIEYPTGLAVLDYLRKWYLYGWAYRDLLRDIPSVSLPDDHDVYHGNIWGEGGKATPREGSGRDRQDSGGYKMPPEWVNMVQRTQTSHLPDPYDPTPVRQGIGVYYTDLRWGGISFAILEDRKFKSAPRNFLPAEADVRNGWAENRIFDIRRRSDVPGAEILGERQTRFLEEWASDWSRGAWMKVVLSQTIFANLATLPEDAISDAAVPQLRILPEGAYAPNDVVVSDMDSNGWPHSSRNQAVDIMRTGFAFHIAGDQHLGSTIQYGVDTWRDAGVAVCVPSISNFWPRRWYPPQAGLNPAPGAPRYTGDFLDGFNNLITVYAVSNPTFSGKQPSALHDRAAGYGIVRFERSSRKIEVALWPRFAELGTPNGKPYAGWPLTFDQMDNYGRAPVAMLPLVRTSGLPQLPVFQVVDEENGKVVYTIRATGPAFQPKVFHKGKYTVRVGAPGTGQWKALTGLKARKLEENRQVMIDF